VITINKANIYKVELILRTKSLRTESS